MIKKIISSILSSVTVISVSSPIFSNTVTTQSTEAQLTKLEQQVDNMQAEIMVLKHQLHSRQSGQIQTVHHRRQSRISSKYKIASNLSSSKQSFASFHTPYQQNQQSPPILQITKVKRQTEAFKPVSNFVVTTSVPDDKSGSALIVNTPSINRDVALLTRRQDLFTKESSLLELGGEMDVKATYTDPYTSSQDTDLDLSTAKLVAFAKPSNWMSGFINIRYDYEVGATPRRISNSKILLDEGFIVFGDLRSSPFYVSVGQMYVPFGRYDSNMISFPLTYYFGDIQSRAVVVGYVPTNFDSSTTKALPYARGFIFKGDAKVGNRNQYGVDAGLHINGPKITSEVGMSYIADIADSDGFQDTYIGNTTKFEGFDASNSEKLKHHVPAVSIHGQLNRGNFGLLVEYAGALRSFDPSDFSYNGKGAQPKTFNVEGSYAFPWFVEYPSSFALGYSRSYEALGLNIPKHRYLATYSINLLKNLVAQLEFDHDINYGKNDVAMGNTNSGMKPAYEAKDLGKTNNGVTAEVNFYF